MLKKALEEIETALIAEFGAGEFALGNIATEMADAKRLMTLINLKEEKALKNTAYSRVNNLTLKTEYFNPFIYLNVYLMFVSKNSTYKNSIEDITRIMQVFHRKNKFEFEDNDEIFKVVLELFSPNFEEINHIWGTLGGKMYPNVIYIMRVAEVKSNNSYHEGDKVIEQINQKFSVIQP